ncbi:hypothetical protein DYB37_005780 [Aphanomyces astaci]|uniref:Protein kinase domain-containing protein n=1 Tax=Aphanomyces astaci TaxID=112090 RepID=A0A3R7AHP7_APHAT|nr:hypothetical protein DYB37_005780 [Aphanomyces astaci]
MFQSTRRRQPRRPAILPSSITRQVACWGIHPTAALQTIRVLHRGLHCVIHAGVFNQQTVAVKSLHSTSSRSIQSFVDEIKLVCSLDSPFLLQAVGVRVRDLHLVVEFMDLGDLQTHLLLHVKRASWPSKLKWARAAARALAHLHGVHVLHRHVKSRHILLHSSGRAVLAGLGNAVSTLAASTTTSPPSSTPHGASFRWMAPEVVASRAPYTAAADVFSLGVVLWELDSLLTPYAREQAQFGWGDVHLMRQIHARRVTLAFSTECPGGVVRVALQCLSADPTRRPTAAQVVDMLSQQDIATAFDTVPTLYH